MSELNTSQKEIAETLEGMIVVDAGPGTGKTKTVVERFVNILRKENITSDDILMLTFTKNAAAEMKDRVKDRISIEPELVKKATFLNASTFDSYCHTVVTESPESVSRFLKMEEKLTRSAGLVENDTINKEYFSDFMDDFMSVRGEDYGYEAAIATQYLDNMYELINRLMSKGIIPLKEGWFGGDNGKVLEGCPKVIRSELEIKNKNPNESDKESELMKSFNKNLNEKKFPFYDYDLNGAIQLPDEMLDEMAFEDRTQLLNLVHDIYYEYIRRSISDNRLTFGLVSTFAFIILYSDEGTRNRMSCKYVMIDEFQDTNSNQLMIALMLLKEPNLCVVGDWKQGIYGFRYVSTDNIINFGKKTKQLAETLNEDDIRVPFKIPDEKRLSLDTNYRSSQKIIDASYECLYLPTTKNEKVDRGEIAKNVVNIHAGREDIGDDTEVCYIKADSNEEEIIETLRRIEDYVHSGKYVIHENETTRSPRYDDIAVLCRTGDVCEAVKEAADLAGIPTFMQGDVNIMGTREGKLALAWLRYVNNNADDWGIGTILADFNYTLSEIRHFMKKGDLGQFDKLPPELPGYRAELVKRKRRINDLLTSIFAIYGLNNDITQAIISQLSSSHRNSLLTVSDLIRMMETDMAKNTKYKIDSVLDSEAVTIQTMHKSKGLEYPIVILNRIDAGKMPSKNGDKSNYILDDKLGIRSKNSVYSFGDDYVSINKSWRTYGVKETIKADKTEERRLMFVAISRAKQYVSIIAGSSPSPFFDTLAGDNIQPAGSGPVVSHGRDSEKILIEKPEIADYDKRRMNVGVHEILHFDGDHIPDNGGDEISGKGMEYGTQIHEIACSLANGNSTDDNRPEIPVIKSILENLKASNPDMIVPEIECSLPFNDYRITLRGVIDLLVLYPDRVEIHDYKTDVSDMFENEYRIQLSVYAQVAKQYYGLPVKCIIDYVSMEKTVEFDPLDLKIIDDRVKEYLNQL